MSEAALVDTIRAELKVLRAAGNGPVLETGKLSDDALDGAMRALNEAYWIAKDKNKKYGRKKKKDAEET